MSILNQVKTAVHGLVSRTDDGGGVGTVGRTGTLGGASVRMASTATAPAHPGGIGEKIKAFFAGLGTGIAHAATSLFQAVQDLFTRAPDTNAPAAPAAQATTAPATSPAAAKANLVKNDPILRDLKDTLAFKAFNSGVDAKSLSTEQRGACAYAYAHHEATRAGAAQDDDVSASLLESFMRSDNSASKISRGLATDSPNTRATTAAILAVLGDNVIAVSTGAYIRAGYSAEPGPAGTPPDKPSLETVARTTVRVIDEALCAFIGDPDDRSSIQDAANRVDQRLCDHLATMKRAIDDSGVQDPAVARKMLLACGRDTLALRGQSPALTDAMAKDPALSPDQKKSLGELNKGFLSIINGVGLGSKDAQPEVLAAGGDLKARWNPAVATFIDMVAARGDPAIVAAAAVDGQALATDYQGIATRVAERTAELTA